MSEPIAAFVGDGPDAAGGVFAHVAEGVDQGVASPHGFVFPANHVRRGWEGEEIGLLEFRFHLLAHFRNDLGGFGFASQLFEGAQEGDDVILFGGGGSFFGAALEEFGAHDFLDHFGLFFVSVGDGVPLAGEAFHFRGEVVEVFRKGDDGFGSVVVPARHGISPFAPDTGDFVTDFGGEEGESGVDVGLLGHGLQISKGIRSATHLIGAVGQVGAYLASREKLSAV